jgi:hypothetical protein
MTELAINIINGETFRTSIDVMKEVMGISTSVIKNELCKNNYHVNDASSNCIERPLF